MKVLVVIPGFDPDGGAERSLHESVPGLLDRGVRLHLAVLTPRQGLVPDAERAGVVIHDLSAATGLFGRVRALRRVMRDIRPDVVHASLFDATVVAQIAVVGTSVPILVTWANTSYGDAAAGEPATRRFKLAVINRVERVLGRVSGSWYHAVTPGVGRAVGQDLRVETSRVLVGRRGRNPEKFHPDGAVPNAFPGLDLPPSARVLLAVGRQDTQKGYEDLLAAFDLLAATRPALHLVIVGREGSATPRIEAVLRSMRHRDRVHLAGQRDDVPQLLRRAEVVACSSWREGAAGALIEAMASGTPVVSVELSGLEGELIDGENAVVVPRRQLADGLAAVLDDPDLAKRLSVGGRRAFERRYTMDASNDRMAEIYRIVATA